jgi:hypothetical protein
MIFQPDYLPSGPERSGDGPNRSYRDNYDRQDNLRSEVDSATGAALPFVNRISNHLANGATTDHFIDDISSSRILCLPIAGVKHRGEAVLTEISREFSNLQFIPTAAQIEFRAALLAALKPSGKAANAPHHLIREERLHRGLGLALSNLVAKASDRSLHELSFGADPNSVVPPSLEMGEYLASAWAVRSFIRMAADEPNLFRILITEMAAIQSNMGRLSLGVPMSPLLVYELFNAAARNPELNHDVIRAFQLIGYHGKVGERLFAEFAAMLAKQSPTLQ